MKTSAIYKLVSPFLMLLLPISLIMLTVGVTIIWKSWSDLKLLKTRTNLTKKKRCDSKLVILGKLATRMLTYQLIIVTFYMIDKNITHGFGLSIGFVTKLVATVLIIINAYQIDQNYKQINGKGLIAYLKDVAGWVKDIKDSGKDLMKILIAVVTIFAILSLTTACTTVRNAEKRHDRIVKNFPNVHKSDTILVEKEIIVQVPGVIDSNLLIFPVQIDTIIDTIYFPNEIIVTNTIYTTEDGRKALKTDIFQPNKNVKVKYIEKQIVKWEKIPIKWYQKTFGIILISLAILILGFILGRIDNFFNKKDSS